MKGVWLIARSFYLPHNVLFRILSISPSRQHLENDTGVATPPEESFLIVNNFFNFKFATFFVFLLDLAADIHLRSVCAPIPV